MAKDSGARNTPHSSINNNYFSGGSSVSRKLGIANSFFDSQGLDFRSDPSQMSVLPGARNITNSLLDLPTAVDQDLNGIRWAVGDKGYLYKIDSSNTVTQIAKLPTNGSAGIYYNQLTDQLYIPGQQEVSLYGRVTQGTPQFLSGQFAESASQANGCVNLFSTPNNLNGGTGAGFWDGYSRNNLLSFATGVTRATINAGSVTTFTTNTYTLGSSIVESSTTACGFVPDIEPFYSIWVYIASVGTGSWTLTLHDGLSNTLASVTISAANLKVGYNEFAFGSQIRAIVSASQTGTSTTYHFHVTQSTKDGKVGTITSNDFSTVDFILFAYRLVQTNNGFHPTTFFAAQNPLLCIGNGNYLATYNFGYDANPSNSMFQRHQLQFKHGFEVTGLTIWNQMLAITVERKSTSSTRNAQGGGIYLWDGITNAPTLYIDIPMGSPYSPYTMNNVMYFTINGSLFAYSGGQTVIKVRKISYQNTDYLGINDTTVNYPNMFTSRYNVLMAGFPSTTTNNNINYGVYSWGAVEMTYPNSWGYSYALSNGYQNNSVVSNLRIGMIQNFVDTMYISYSYTLSGVTYNGLDIVDNYSTPASSFSWTSLIWDGGARYKTKQALRMKISFTALPSGCTITPFYSINRGANVIADPDTGASFTQSTAGQTSVVVEINNGRFHELQWGFLGTNSNAVTTPLTISGVTMEVNPLQDEIDLRKDG